jgi:hypothetical protein
MKGAKPSFGGPPGVAALGGRFLVFHEIEISLNFERRY